MVKKFFRPFICAVCAAMSLTCSIVPFSNVFAAETDNVNVASDEETEKNDQDIGDDQNKDTEENKEDTKTEVNEEESDKSETEEVTQEDEKTSETPEETEKTETSETEKNTEDSSETSSVQNSISVNMDQNMDAITPDNELKQTVSVKYSDAVNSSITFNVDPSLDLNSIEVGSNTYLEGGTATIYSKDGTTDIGITSTIDLSGYTDVTSVTFTPKSISYTGMEAKFTAVMKLKKTASVENVTCSVSVTATKDENSANFSSSCSAKVENGSVSKPSLALSYDGNQYGDEQFTGTIEFGKQFDLNISGIEMKTYDNDTKAVYSITTPEFLTVKNIVVPKLENVSKVKVTAKVNGTDKDLGEVEPGATVSLDATKVSEIKFEFTSEGNVTTSGSGKIVVANDITTNKETNTASFKANANVIIGEKEYSMNSNIISVNVAPRVVTEPEKPKDQTNNPDNTGGSTSGGGSSADNSGNTDNTSDKTDDKTDDTTNEADETRKKEEAERKETAKKQALQNEQEMKNKQNSILAARLSKLNASSGSSGSSSTSTSTKSSSSTKDSKYADWTVKPIFEDIVSDLIPKDIDPILESMIENLVPETAEESIAEATETAE